MERTRGSQGKVGILIPQVESQPANGERQEVVISFLVKGQGAGQGSSEIFIGMDTQTGSWMDRWIFFIVHFDWMTFSEVLRQYRTV